MYKKVFAVFFLPFIIFISIASDKKSTEKPNLSLQVKEQQWVDSVFQSMTPDEKLGQLFMVAAYSNGPESQQTVIDQLISTYNIGGLIFFQGGPVRQAQLTNRYQSLAKVPLLIGMDAEWGLAMRLDSTISYPKQMTLGAIQNNDYIYRMGAEVARQCQRLGVHINFAPVVDINSNPTNPVIGFRSFGENKENVATKGLAYMNGLQHNGVLASAKHFPGHGDASTDSHFALPVISQSKSRMQEVELYPFRKLFADSLKSVLVAHLQVPSLDKTKNLATTLSKPVVTDLLKKAMGFEGLVFTDALNMKGVSKYYKSGELEVMALQAGNDVLLFSEDVPEAIAKIKKAIKSKQLKQIEIDSKVRKVLTGKYWAGLHTRKPVELTNLYEDLNNVKAQTLNYDLYEQAMTVVKNKGGLLPFRFLDTTSFASVTIGLPASNSFQDILSRYASFEHHSIEDKDTSEAAYTALIEKLRNFDVVVVSLHGMNNTASKAYGLSQSSRTFIERLRTKTNLVVSVFGNPYSLKYFNNINHLICVYEDNEVTQKLVPQVIFGALPATGKLPVSAQDDLKEGTGIATPAIKRLAYSIPERVGMSSKTLLAIDNIVNWAIDDQMMPGCQVLVAKNGQVVFEKAYGYMTYDKKEPVTLHTIYDIASVTKVAATLQAIMFLHERQLLDVNQKASFYLPELRGTNKENALVRDILMHQAGLIAFQPHWEKTRTRSGLNPAYYSSVKDEQHPIEVATGLYSIASLKDSLWRWTINSRLLSKPARQEKHNFEYSDLSFYILKELAERLLNQPIESFLAQNIYAPLGLDELTFNPSSKFGPEKIAPTEKDKLFRHMQVRGTVHDPGAALMGGVSGHAGLFSTANDLAVLFQMNLQNGYYGGRRYFMDNTVPTFTKSYNKGNRRGLGWDRPRPEGGGHVSDLASRNSYGHTGFTGTCVWVDPDEDIVFVFLSNRVYPDAENNKLAKFQIRRRVQDVIYKSLINYQVLNTSIKQ
jgi:beta-glucosidase-like glycosyl hydrolase/CubicO group peptidase (beta-lactamase class C family)